MVDLKPVAYRWSQLMHDSMGGWEEKHESGKPGGRVRDTDVRDLTPLVTLSQAQEAVRAARAEERERCARVRSALIRMLGMEYDGHGLTDCIDNQGGHYPSQDLANAIAEGEAAIRALDSTGEADA